MERPEYLPHDQRKHLGPPPWSPMKDSPALQAWEKAHNHDVRVKCLPELGCVAVEYEAEYLRWLLWQFADADKQFITFSDREFRVALFVKQELVDEAAHMVGYDEQGQ